MIAEDDVVALVAGDVVATRAGGVIAAAAAQYDVVAGAAAYGIDAAIVRRRGVDIPGPGRAVITDEHPVVAQQDIAIRTTAAVQAIIARATYEEVGTLVTPVIQCVIAADAGVDALYPQELSAGGVGDAGQVADQDITAAVAAEDIASGTADQNVVATAARHLVVVSQTSIRGGQEIIGAGLAKGGEITDQPVITVTAVQGVGAETAHQGIEPRIALDAVVAAHAAVGGDETDQYAATDHHLAEVTQHHVVAVIAVQGIVGRPAKDDVVIAIAVDGIGVTHGGLAGAAVTARGAAHVTEQDVVAGTAVDRVTTLLSVDDVITAIAAQVVIARSAPDDIIAVTATYRVVVVIAREHIVAAIAFQGIGTGAAIHRIRAVAALQDVTAAAAVEDIGALAGHQLVVATITIDGVIAATAVQLVVAIPAAQGVVALAKDQQGVVADAAIGLDIGEHARTDHHVVVAVARVANDDLPHPGIDLGLAHRRYRHGFGTRAAGHMGHGEGLGAVGLEVFAAIAGIDTHVQIEGIARHARQHRRGEGPDDLAAQGQEGHLDGHGQAHAGGTVFELALDTGDGELDVGYRPRHVDLDADRSPGTAIQGEAVRTAVADTNLESALEHERTQRNVDTDDAVHHEGAIRTDVAVDIQGHKIEEVDGQVIERDHEQAIVDADGHRTLGLQHPDPQGGIDVHQVGIGGNGLAADLHGLIARVDLQGEVAAQLERAEAQCLGAQVEIDGEQVATDDSAAFHADLAEEIEIQGGIEVQVDALVIDGQIDPAIDLEQGNLDLSAEYDTEGVRLQGLVDHGHLAGAGVHGDTLDRTCGIRGVQLDLEGAAEAQREALAEVHGQGEAAEYALVRHLEITHGPGAADGLQVQGGTDEQFELVGADLETERAIELEEAGNIQLAVGLDDEIRSGSAKGAIDLGRTPRHDDVFLPQRGIDIDHAVLCLAGLDDVFVAGGIHDLPARILINDTDADRAIDAVAGRRDGVLHAARQRAGLAIAIQRIQVGTAHAGAGQQLAAAELQAVEEFLAEIGAELVGYQEVLVLAGGIDQQAERGLEHQPRNDFAGAHVQLDLHRQAGIGDAQHAQRIHPRQLETGRTDLGLGGHEHPHALGADFEREGAAQGDQFGRHSAAIGLRQADDHAARGLDAEQLRRQHIGLGQVTAALGLAFEGDGLGLGLSGGVDLQGREQIRVDAQRTQLLEVGSQADHAPELRRIADHQDEAARHGGDVAQVDQAHGAAEVQRKADGICVAGIGIDHGIDGQDHAALYAKQLTALERDVVIQPALDQDFEAGSLADHAEALDFLDIAAAVIGGKAAVLEANGHRAVLELAGEEITVGVAVDLFAAAVDHHRIAAVDGVALENEFSGVVRDAGLVEPGTGRILEHHIDITPVIQGHAIDLLAKGRGDQIDARGHQVEVHGIRKVGIARRVGKAVCIEGQRYLGGPGHAIDDVNLEVAGEGITIGIVPDLGRRTGNHHTANAVAAEREFIAVDGGRIDFGSLCRGVDDIDILHAVDDGDAHRGLVQFSAKAGRGTQCLEGFTAGQVDITRIIGPGPSLVFDGHLAGCKTAGKGIAIGGLGAIHLRRTAGQAHAGSRRAGQHELVPVDGAGIEAAPP